MTCGVLNLEKNYTKVGEKIMKKFVESSIISQANFINFIFIAIYSLCK